MSGKNWMPKSIACGVSASPGVAAVLVRPRRRRQPPQRRVVRIAHAESAEPPDRREALLPGVVTAVLVTSASGAAAIGAEGGRLDLPAGQGHQDESARDDEKN